MNWQAMGAIGEIFGGVAVLATLVYLTIQIRSIRQSYISDVLDSVVDAEIQIHKMQLENADLIQRGNDCEELQPSEWYKIDQIFQCHVSFAFHGHVKEKFAGGKNRVRARELARVLINNPAYMRCWRQSEIPDVKEIKDYVDTVNHFIGHLEKGS